MLKNLERDIKRRTKMNRVIIELEFDDKPTDADVYNYLNELMDNDCLSYEIKENENETI
jgi:hypothetical protein